MSTERGNKRVMFGIIKSAGKMDKTVTVLVEQRVKEPRLKKYITRHRKYLAHDEQNQYQVGDKVTIIESRPLSKNKRWRVQKLIERKPGV
ncbi:30S ribosomal protein S17 [Myxococcota bacterium]|nr:30S ribosomal protein S17 [Myxococcota bacterium]